MRWFLLLLLAASFTAIAQDAPPKSDCTAFPNLAPYVPGCKEFIPKPAPLAPPSPSLSHDQYRVALTDWATSLRKCAVATVGALDDGLSDANTIAIGVQARCVANLPPLVDLMGVDRANDFLIKMHPSLVEIVLAHRTKRGATKSTAKSRQM